MWPKYASIMSENVPQEDQIFYLNLVSQNENSGSLNESDARSLMHTIKNWISDPMTRCKGLMLWEVALQKNNLYINSWSKEVTACLTLSASSSARSLGTRVLNEVVERFGNVSQHNSSFQRELPSLINLILDNLKEEDVVATCCILSSCIRIFPEISGSKLVRIEEYLVTHFDKEDVQIVEAISNVFATLPNCMVYHRRPRHPFCEGWKTLQTKALNALYSLYEDITLYETGANGPREENSRSPVFENMPGCQSEGGAPYLCHKMRLFTSVSRCLAKLICSESLRVTVDLEEMLEFIHRIIAFPQPGARKVDNSLVNLIYPQLSRCAFWLLEAIILKSNVLEHTVNIITVALKGTSYHRDVKLSTWKFLNKWMCECGCDISSKIISEVVVDDLLANLNIEQEAASNYKTAMCIEALKALNSLLKSAFCFFSEKSIESIVVKILDLIVRVQVDRSNLKQYSDDLCREELYNILLVLCTVDHAQRAKCVRKGVHIFKNGLKDQCSKITSLCNLASQQLVTFLHPKKPTSEHIQSVDRNNIVGPDDESGNPWGSIPQETEVNYDADHWPHNQPNGQVAPANNLAAPDLYPAEGAFQGVEMEVENSQEILEEQELNSHYAQLEPSNHYSNSRTVSSLSEEEEEYESEEEVENEGNRRHVPNKHLPTDIPSAQPTNRPNIQILEAHSTPLAREARTEEESSNANASVHDVESEHESLEEEEEDGTPLSSPKRAAMSENGREESEEEVEEQSEEGDDDVDDDNDDDGEDVEELGEHHSEEVAEDIPSEDRLSNRSEERSSPKSEDRLSPKSEERLSPKSEERLSPKSDDRLSPKSYDRLSPKSEDRLSPKSEDRLSPKSDDRLSPKSEERLSPGREQRIPPEAEERPTKKRRLNEVEADSNHRTTDSDKMGCNEESKPELNGQQENPTKTADEMLVDFICEVPPEHLEFIDPKPVVEEEELS